MRNLYISKTPTDTNVTFTSHKLPSSLKHYLYNELILHVSLTCPCNSLMGVQNKRPLKFKDKCLSMSLLTDVTVRILSWRVLIKYAVLTNLIWTQRSVDLLISFARFDWHDIFWLELHSLHLLSHLRSLNRISRTVGGLHVTFRAVFEICVLSPVFILPFISKYHLIITS